MKLQIFVCFENGDIVESDMVDQDMSQKVVDSFIEHVQQFKDLDYLEIVRNGHRVFLNPTKIMWIEARIYE